MLHISLIGLDSRARIRTRAASDGIRHFGVRVRGVSQRPGGSSGHGSRKSKSMYIAQMLERYYLSVILMVHEWLLELLTCLCTGSTKELVCIIIL